MQVYWRRHVFVIAFTTGTWILIWILDYTLMGPRSEGWVPIDLRGFLTGAYIAATLVFALATTALVATLKPTRLLAASILYLAAFVGVLALSALSFGLWSARGEGNLEDAYERMSIAAQSLSRTIELLEWQPKDRSVNIVLEVLELVESVKVEVQAKDAEGSIAAVGERFEGRIARGQRTISVPLQRFGTEQGEQWRIRLLLEHKGVVADVEFAMTPVESEGALVGRRLPAPRSD